MQNVLRTASSCGTWAIQLPLLFTNGLWTQATDWKERDKCLYERVMQILTIFDVLSTQSDDLHEKTYI